MRYEKNGNVICTAMTYGDRKIIIESFSIMIKKFNYPDGTKMKFLDDAYFKF